MLVRSKFFPRFVEKIEKLKRSSSKQHKKMLKVRSEMQKIRKKWQNDQAREKFPEKSTENFSNPGNPENFRDPGNFPGKLKIWEKGKPYSGFICISLLS